LLFLSSTLPIAIFICLLTGCVTIDPDGTLTRHYFGYVKVIVPLAYDPSGTTRAVETTTIGVRVENGVMVGYVHDKLISVPLDCRLVVMVRNNRQLDEAVDKLAKASRGDVCAVVNRE
jgi:hypothetical protein